ncbi:MAG: type IV secretory pathway VirB4 component [Candidatus Paceibacteria bacterium]|jgi:conjugal transfer ATP-binding protein TraC
MSLFSEFLGTSNNKGGVIKKTAVPVLPGEIYRTAKLQLQDILAPAALEVSSKSIKIAGKTSRTFFVMSYPRFLTDGWLAPIVNLDKVFDIGIHIHPIPTEKILSEFKKKVAEVQSQINSRESKGLVRDPILDTAYRDLESLRDALQQAQEKIFSVGLYITIYADSEDELFKTENEIRSLLESKLIYLKPALFQQMEGFMSVAPIGVDKLQVHTKLNTGPVSSFFPFISSELTDNKGILYGVNRHNSGLVIFDRYSLPNYNSVIFATSGAGKSYATKLEILRTMMFDTEVIVIDPEREYEYLAEAVGGRYFNISLSSEHHINPFDVPKALEDEDPADVIRTHIIHLVGLFRIMLGGLSPEEDSVVDRAITETYALKDITPNSNYADIEPPLMSDFEMVLSSMEGSESLLMRLTKYTRGTWSGFINKPSNVDINKKLVVFSIRDMEDDLKPAAMYIITQFIWNAVRKNVRKRLLVVDEAWWMMKSDDTASFLFMIAKRGRKYFLGLATITQDVGDFIKSKYGIPIITNSSMQLLLKQSPSAIDNLQEVFRLTDEEKYLLIESNVGEGIFFAGLKHVAIKIIASYTEDQIITSDPAQVLSIKKARAELKESQENQGYVN